MSTHVKEGHFWKAAASWFIPVSLVDFSPHLFEQAYDSEDDVAQSAAVGRFMMPYHNYIWSGRNTPYFSPNAILRPVESQLFWRCFQYYRSGKINFIPGQLLHVTDLFRDPALNQYFFGCAEKKGIIPVDSKHFKIVC